MLRITDDGSIMRVMDRLENMRSKIPVAAGRDAFDAAQTIGSQLLQSAQQAGIKPMTGRLFGHMYPRKMGKNEYAILMPKYAFQLDRMKPHPVWIYKHGSLMQWADKWMGGYRGRITVRPYPFIDRGLSRAGRIIKQRLRNGHVMKEVRRKK